MPLTDGAALKPPSDLLSKATQSNYKNSSSSKSWKNVDSDIITATYSTSTLISIFAINKDESVSSRN